MSNKERAKGQEGVLSAALVFYLQSMAKRQQVNTSMTKKKGTTVDRTGKVRSRDKEMAWMKAQAAPMVAAELLKSAPHPSKFSNFRGLGKLLENAKFIERMRLGIHGKARTPVSALRQAIQRIDSNASGLSPECRGFVQSISTGMLKHLGCSNTDKSYRSFAVVLVAILELAKMLAP